MSKYAQAKFKAGDTVKVSPTGRAGEVVDIDASADPVYYTVLIEGAQYVYPESLLEAS
jgi:hypothetical protein